MAKRYRRKKAVETLLHEEASRVYIPTAEYESVLREEDKSPIQVAYERPTVARTASAERHFADHAAKPLAIDRVVTTSRGCQESESGRLEPRHWLRHQHQAILKYVRTYGLRHRDSLFLVCLLSSVCLESDVSIDSSKALATRRAPTRNVTAQLRTDNLYGLIKRS